MIQQQRELLPPPNGSPVSGRWHPHFWNLPAPPAGSNLWVFKTVQFHSVGRFHSLQLPSGITLRLLTSGTGVVRVNQRQWQTKPGDLFCAIPGVLIEMYDTPDAPWCWLEWQVTGSGAMGYIESLGLTPQLAVRTVSFSEQAQATFQQLHDELGKEDRNPYSALSHLYQLSRDCNHSQARVQPAPERRSQIVNDAVAYYNSQFSADININALAAGIGVNRTTLLRAFRQQLGLTPLEYLQRQRLIKAEEFLALSDLPLKTIARSVGFRNEKYFSRCFCQKHGIPPGQWRKRRQNQNSE